MVLSGVDIATHAYDPLVIAEGSYRPFTKQHVYFDRRWLNRVYQLPSMYPVPAHRNVGIVVTGPASHFEFAPFAASLLPDLHLLDTCQFFPRWTYERADSSDGGFDFGIGEYGFRKIDNITDAIHSLYRQTLRECTEDDIFYYVYGLLYDPVYRETDAANLKKLLPTSRRRLRASGSSNSPTRAGIWPTYTSTTRPLRSTRSTSE